MSLSKIYLLKAYSMGCDLVHGLFAEVNDIGIFGQKEDAIKEMHTYISEGLEDHLEYIMESETQTEDQSIEKIKDVYYRENPRYIIVERPIGLDEECYDEMVNFYFDAIGNEIQVVLPYSREFFGLEASHTNRYKQKQVIYFYHGLTKKMMPAVVVSTPLRKGASKQKLSQGDNVYTISYESLSGGYMERCQVTEAELFSADEIPNMFIANESDLQILVDSFSSVGQLN